METRTLQLVKPKCKIAGTNGNIYILGGLVNKALHEAGQGYKCREFNMRLWTCMSYNEALISTREYVEVE